MKRTLRIVSAPASRLGASPAPTRALWFGVAAILPTSAVLLVFVAVLSGQAEVIDFHSFHAGAGALLRGESPYPEYVYPPLTAIVSLPLALLPLGVAEVLVMAGLASGVAATLIVLGVRDWRCYGIAFLWPPVLSAIQTGNITILLGLGAALAWRFRDRPRPTSLSIGMTLAAKFFLWPLVVWLAATRRFVTAVLACAAGAALLVLSWAVIGFAGLADYIDIVRGVQSLVEHDAYTAYVLALDAGASTTLARFAGLTLAALALAIMVVLGRRGDERGAFVLAIAATLAFSPIVWLHYFELLLVGVAVAQPRLGIAWFVPLVMYVSTGNGNGTPAQTAATLAAAALTIALALRASRRTAPAARRAVRAPAWTQTGRAV